MIVVELRTKTGIPIGDPAKVIATITVDEHGALILDPPDDAGVLEHPVPGPGRRRVTAADDPVLWARSLPRAFRTPHLHAVLVRDDQDEATAGRPNVGDGPGDIAPGSRPRKARRPDQQAR